MVALVTASSSKINSSSWPNRSSPGPPLPLPRRRAPRRVPASAQPVILETASQTPSNRYLAGSPEPQDVIISPRCTYRSTGCLRGEGRIGHVDVPDSRKNLDVKVHNCLVSGQENPSERFPVVFFVPAQDHAGKACIRLPQRTKGRVDVFIVHALCVGGQLGGVGRRRRCCRLQFSHDCCRYRCRCCCCWRV